MSSNTPSSSSSSTRAVSRVQLLMELQRYATATDHGHQALKDSIWLLTKSRRNQNRGIYSLESKFCADQVREEFLPRTMISPTKNKKPSSTSITGRSNDNNKEPRLISETTKLNVNTLEDGSNDDGIHHHQSNIPSSPAWELIDTVEERLRNKENKTAISTPTANVAGASDQQTTILSSRTGLRQRKKHGPVDENQAISSSKGNMVVVQENSEVAKNENEDNVMILDPLEMFSGLPPKELKAAQQKAKEALASYIVAANQAAIILGMLKTNGTT